MPDSTDPLSYGEMIAAYREVLDDQEKIAHIFPDGPAALRIDKLHALLAHLGRTPATDTQADLTERAREPTKEALRVAWYCRDRPVVDAALEIDRFTQSEREADAAEARRAAINAIAERNKVGLAARLAALQDAALLCEERGAFGCAERIRNLASPRAPQETP